MQWHWRCSYASPLSLAKKAFHLANGPTQPGHRVAQRGMRKPTTHNESALPRLAIPWQAEAAFALHRKTSMTGYIPPNHRPLPPYLLCNWSRQTSHLTLNQATSNKTTSKSNVRESHSQTHFIMLAGAGFYAQLTATSFEAIAISLSMLKLLVTSSLNVVSAVPRKEASKV